MTHVQPGPLFWALTGPLPMRTKSPYRNQSQTHSASPPDSPRLPSPGNRRPQKAKCTWCGPPARTAAGTEPGPGGLHTPSSLQPPRVQVGPASALNSQPVPTRHEGHGLDQQGKKASGGEGRGGGTASGPDTSDILTDAWTARHVTDSPICVPVSQTPSGLLAALHTPLVYSSWKLPRATLQPAEAQLPTSSRSRGKPRPGSWLQGQTRL